MTGKLWVIEGADGSGKKTQTELLVKRLNQSGILGGHKAHLWSFPTYEDPVWGKLIKEYLSNPTLKADEVDPKYASLLYAGDRGKAAAKFRPLLEAGDWIICDRYTQSNMAHQGAKIDDIEAKNSFVAWLEELEYEQLGIPRPTGIIYLSLPAEISQRRAEERRQRAFTENRGGELSGQVRRVDIHEQDKEYMRKVREEYLRLAKLQGWYIIECFENNRELDTEEVGQRVWEIVTKN